MQLLAFMDGVQTMIETVRDFFVGFKVVYGIEIFFFFLLFYYVSKVLRENDATKLMLGYWALIVLIGVMNIFASEIFNAQFLLLFMVILSAVMIILFNVEVKKALWDVHKSKDRTMEKSGGFAETSSVEEVERCIDSVIKSVQNMSKNKTGALIVLSRGNLPKQVLQSGVRLEAEISAQLIEGVFFPNSPLHDGAMIVRGHKIQAAGCFLPLTQKTSYPKEFGTRHRAGIGITEVANVISIVVSEETGIISIIKQGNVERFPDAERLKKALRDYYWQELPITDKKTKVVISK